MNRLSSRRSILKLQKQLLSKDQTLSVQEVINICRIHEASIHHMRQLADIQDHKGKDIDAIKHTPSETRCRRCGGAYTHTKERCSTYGTVCSACYRKNLWTKVCMNKTRPHTTLRRPVPKGDRGPRSETNRY